MSQYIGVSRFSSRLLLRVTAFLLTLVLLFSLWQCATSSEEISYNEHIRPIFNKNCLPCHGGVKKLGGFSLLFPEEAFDTTASGVYAIVPGHHKRSELYRRLVEADPELRMPLEGHALSADEIDLIAIWIDQGAEWEQHWAYDPPRLPAVPEFSNEWGHSAIDAFIERKLAEKELSPSPEADRPTLIRRLSLDLTGLPPSPEAVDAFVADTDPQAYDKLVDSLLASPHFGERWASLWLDLARYADSKGYEKDPYRSIWRYRDWVINAFNKDMPFDQFTIEQLAGDLLPDPDREQLIATAFHRNTMTNTEGGTEDEEFRIAAVIDRLNTTYEVWQATTMSCVQCHSHPYDPIRHEEFFQSYDLFNQTQDNDLDLDVPLLATYSPGQEQEIQEIIDYLRQLETGPAIDTTAVLDEQIRQAIYPILRPVYADDFENVQFMGNGAINNWSYNLQASKGKRFRLLFSNVDLTGVPALTYYYKAEGQDARLELRLDRPDGPLLDSTALTPTADRNTQWGSGGYEPLRVSIEPVSGRHDLFLEIINTTGAIPDGMMSLDRIELHGAVHAPAGPVVRQEQERLIALRQQADDYLPIIRSKTPAFARTTRLFERGNWLAQSDTLSARAPAAFRGDRSDPTDRLAFARWLVSADNPLTARVMVNRFWEQLFGRGIVETLEDFGTQGATPTHPELLDYLALQFMHSHQWSVKKLLREIVLSATYRQTSKANAELLEQDPYNQWYARGPRFRLSAEQIRDQVLAVSGLLHDSIGGRSVMPPQPEGIWQVVYSGERWQTADGADRYRRSLYTYWKRTAPYPAMIAFDSPSREFCVSRRIRTNTPLQALVTLNDPAMLEAARALGQRMQAKGGDEPASAIRAGYRLVLGRAPSPETVAVLEDLYDQAAAALIAESNGEVVAMADDTEEFHLREPLTVVANALLNLDAFLVKE